MDEDPELRVAQHAISADQHYKTVKSLMIVAFAVFFMFVAYQLLATDRHNQARNNEILNKAEELSKDGRIRIQENYRYITCILIHPIEVRTTRLQTECFRQSDLPGGLHLKDFIPTEPPLSASFGAPVLLSVSPNLDQSIIYLKSLSNTTLKVEAIQSENSQSISQNKFIKSLIDGGA